jgi:hypothetical protein
MVLMVPPDIGGFVAADGGRGGKRRHEREKMPAL